MRRWWRRNRVSEDTLAEADNNDTQPTVLWWEQLITTVLWIFVTAFLLVTLIAVIIPDFFPSWFGVRAVEVNDPNVRQYIPQKTLWDWFGLIAIPLAIVVVGYMLNRADRAHERRLQDQRIKESREIEEKRLVENQKLEEKRLEDTRQIEQERTQDTIVKDYFDQMTELLLHHQLRESSENAEVRSVARARTLTALRGVDGERKGMIIQFLYESRLIGYLEEDKCVGAIVDMTDANLTRIILSEAHFPGINLSGSNLCNADLSVSVFNRANFYKAQLVEADLEASLFMNANFNEANFHRANLCGVVFSGTTFECAEFIEANLQGTGFYKANLYGARLTGQDLSSMDFQSAQFENAELTGANFSRSDLRLAKFAYVHLSNVDFSRAELDYADMFNSHLKDACFEGARLTETDMGYATDITAEQLLQAESLSGTKLPNYIDPADLGDKWSPPPEKKTIPNSHTPIQ